VTPPDWLTREIVSYTVLCLSAIGFCCMMLFASYRSDKIRCTDVMTGDNGRLASNKTFQTVTFLVSVWIMVDMTIRGSMNETLLLGWCAVWGGLTAVNKALNNNAVAKAQESAAASGAPPPTAAEVIGKSE
jgi:hypothetical protein